ncbi:SPOSA6832_01663 [Sporobolomyces salmonicolor]|uniref:SPOSA6832_01663-mRNA-1:cds n=1 Tax=Sporidiobolus salmonicolor TaxID=5005 RepID=A0A0D6EKC6_SPOSA|nr:SPOSA6832_01663 [Sporobolomyces salmonicolor]
MLLSRLGALLPFAAHLALARPAIDPAPQIVLSSIDPAPLTAQDLADDITSLWPTDGDGTGTGHLSQWSNETKVEFLNELRNNTANDWLVVMGNEAGDLDSMVSAMALAYAFSHMDPPQKAIALLQTEEDALDLRPENQLSLTYARMSTGHRDLLTIDELPINPTDMWHRIKGKLIYRCGLGVNDWLTAVAPQASLSSTTTFRERSGKTPPSSVDHHDDQGLANGTANPRIIRSSGSCSSLVTKFLFDNVPGADKEKNDPPPSDSQVGPTMHGPIPTELIELLLRTIAIDTNGLRGKSSQPIDMESALRLFPRSSWKRRELKEVMKVLDKDLSASRKALDSLDLRSLLRRDWKGDAIPTKSSKYPHLHIGFASSPVSLEEQILRTPEQTPPEWFAWTSEIQADVSVALSNFRHPKTGRKTRQLALVVAHGYGKRLHEGSANRLFRQLKHAIESAGVDDLDHWHRPDGKKLLPRRAVYEYESPFASRKFWRPIIEKAAREWDG